MAVYIDPMEVPFDVYEVNDVGDDPKATWHITPETDIPADIRENIGMMGAESFAATGPIVKNDPLKKAPHLVVPFTRIIRLGDVGRDVIGAKRAIWKGNRLPIPVKATQLFGAGAVTQLRKFQKAHKLDNDGVLGSATLKVLAPYFDQLAFFDYVGYPPGASHQSRIVAYAWWGYNNRGAISYSQYRPMSYLWDLEHLPITEDCSTFTTKGYKYSNVPDPNGFSYNGYGNTDSQRAHGTRVLVASCLPADLAHYDNPGHVAIVVRHGPDAAVISLGSSIGPLFLPINYRPLYAVMRYAM